MKIIIETMLKPDVLDAEGQAILHSLRFLGFENVTAVRRRKIFECTIEHDDPKEALKQAEDMCDKLLVNQIIEDYTLHLKEPELEKTSP